MVNVEREWLKELSTVADECGLDYEDTAPECIEKQGWDAARECLLRSRFCSCWADSHIHMLVECFDANMTPVQVQTLAIAEGVWPPKGQ